MTARLWIWLESHDSVKRARACLVGLTLLVLGAGGQTACAIDVATLNEGSPTVVFRMIGIESREPLLKHGEVMTEEAFEKRMASWKKTGRAVVAKDGGFLLPLSEDGKLGAMQAWPGLAPGTVIQSEAGKSTSVTIVNGVTVENKTVERTPFSTRKTGLALAVRGQIQKERMKFHATTSVWLVDGMEFATALDRSIPLSKFDKDKVQQSEEVSLEWTAGLGSCAALCFQSKNRPGRYLTVVLIPVAQRPALVRDRMNTKLYDAAKGTLHVVSGRVPLETFWQVMHGIRPDIERTATGYATTLLDLAWSDEKWGKFAKVMEATGGSWQAPTYSGTSAGMPAVTLMTSDGVGVAAAFAVMPKARTMRMTVSVRTSTTGANGETQGRQAQGGNYSLIGEVYQKRWNLVVSECGDQMFIAAFCPVLEEAVSD